MKIELHDLKSYLQKMYEEWGKRANSAKSDVSRAYLEGQADAFECLLFDLFGEHEKGDVK